MATKVKKVVSAVTSPVVSLQTVVDQLGRVKAEIKDLEEREAFLKAQLKDSQLEEVEGELFRATVSRFDKEKVDWKAIAATFKPSTRLVKKFTTSEECITVRVVSR